MFFFSLVAKSCKYKYLVIINSKYPLVVLSNDSMGWSLKKMQIRACNMHITFVIVTVTRII